jgi:hypothetical protein
MQLPAILVHESPEIAIAFDLTAPDEYYIYGCCVVSKGGMSPPMEPIVLPWSSYKLVPSLG